MTFAEEVGSYRFRLFGPRFRGAELPNFWNPAACGGQRYGLCVGSGRHVDPKHFRQVLRNVIVSTTQKPSPTEPAAALESQTA